MKSFLNVYSVSSSSSFFYTFGNSTLLITAVESFHNVNVIFYRV